jgi:hypothetical protein
VLASWGPTARELRAQALAAAKAAAERAAQERAAAGDVPATRTATVPDKTPAIGAVIGGAPGISVTLPGVAGQDRAKELGLAAPNRLGGPKTDAKRAQPAAAGPGLETRHARFLRQAHAAACKRFGTVLGPEANDAHKNHLHLDMAERQRSSFCE